MTNITKVKLDKGTIPMKDTKLVLANGALSGAKDAFDKAFELGTPFYNTAEVYGDGESEREIYQVIVATMYYTHRDRTGFPQVARLGTFSVHLYQIHSPVHIDSTDIVADALADAYDAEEVKRVHAALERRSISLASNQVSYSLIPIGMGLLTGKYNAYGPFPKRHEKLFSSLDTTQLSSLLQVLKTMSEKYRVPQSTIALNWCIVKGTIPLGGVRTGIQMKQNALALGFRLADEDINALDKFAFLGTNNKEWQHG
ncbi:NADP-dependent oxidoreductase domain-containing protein [Helicostylum pulchrum]|nr:NADP-dependent oxidoreductase domain-containing protein [Helicostylum pulchrum]